MSMQATYDRAPHDASQRILLVMLPAAQTSPQHLAQHGFIEAVRERKLPVDVVLAHADEGYYFERTVCSHLTDDIIAPARAANCRRIWLMGISLGGMGALLYAQAHAADIEGVILLAPYLGASGSIAAIANAGGLAHWQPAANQMDDDDSRLLAWLKAYQPACPVSP
ncbi:MAG: alpha/beta hydrolase, partial [Burkholderiales bacterium]